MGNSLAGTIGYCKDEYMEETALQNLMLEEIQYHIEETAWGRWRRFVYPDGKRFAEFKSHRTWGELPLVHYTYGNCPETGKRIVARGVIAVGRLARGFVAIGQASLGIIAIGQLSIGLLLSVGQAALGCVCLGQLALGMLFGAGQFAAGYVAIGQFAIGTYALAQFALGDHVVDARTIDPVAKDFFLGLVGR
jgi:hypothetical protein